MGNSNLKDLAIVIVSFNSRDSLKNTLTSIQNVTTDKSIEIILVDNNSNDQSVALTKEIFPKCKIIENSRNIGFAKACNKGADIAESRYLLFLNPDVQLDKDAVDKLFEAYRNYDKAGVMGGRMRFPDGSFQPTCRRFPNLKNIFFSRGSFLSKLKNKKNTYTLGDFNETTPVDAVAGTMMMIESELFKAVNGFDPDYFMYWEDTDLCLRLHRLGRTNYFVPNSGGVHLWGKGSKAGYIKRAFYHHISTWKFFKKHFNILISFLILPILLTGNFILTVLIPKKNR